MVKLTGNQKIEGFEPQEVFSAGAMAVNLPAIDGITLEAKDDILREGTEIGVVFNLGVPVPGLPTVFEVHSNVMKAISGESMLIEGASVDNVVRASLLLELEKIRNGGSLVHHSLDVTFKGRRRTTMMAIPAKIALEPKIRDFSEKHVGNIEKYLGGRAVSLGKKQPRVALKGATA